MFQEISDEVKIAKWTELVESSMLKQRTGDSDTDILDV